MYCIADQDTVRGFRLAGVPGRAAATPGEAAAALAAAVALPECALLVVTEDLAEGLLSLLEDLRGKRDRPLLVAIPGPGGARAGPASLRQRIQRVVGADLEREP